ncbi:hypothetical protein Ga0466249_004854 [Sporomusaceae bacterium BoRhaA]|uniref:hypothetical protein n=1 Tax=Pelorhabdus rhamnosifermentans TaxID=2772457 RepID=UPI001C060D47|nr:hypothetical protein [Pelorhabdus rhamnosifermentans]MBU2703706.1 hypothetical protein [Pelorhabdus rhamnosifermentans]
MKNKIIALILCMICIFFLASCGQSSANNNDTKPNIKYVDIYDVVKEAFITDNGYTNELAKHMTEEVFKHTNYKKYPANNPKYIEPFKVDFSLNEVCQTKDKENDLVYVDMIYSTIIKDANNNMVGGARDAHVTYIVRIDEKGWYIIDMHSRL